MSTVKLRQLQAKLALQEMKADVAEKPKKTTENEKPYWENAIALRQAEARYLLKLAKYRG